MLAVICIPKFNNIRKRNVERQILHKSQLHFKLQSEYIVDRV